MNRTAWMAPWVGLLFFISSPAFGQTQLEMNEEAAKHARKADEALNVAYQELLKAAGDEKAVEKLRISQRAWMKFRDAECEFESDRYRGGSIVPLIYWKAYKRMTDVRTAELRAHIKDLKEP